MRASQNVKEKVYVIRLSSYKPYINIAFWNETTVLLNAICMIPRYFFYAYIVRCAAYGAACPRIWLIAPFPWPQNTMHIFNLFLAFFGLVWKKFAPFLHKAGKL